MKAILSMVQLGSSGDAVARLHEALAWLGFEVDAVERRQRKFDVRTLGHVQKLQKSLGLHTQTGEVDAETVVALNRLMAEKELIDALGKDGALTQALAVTGTLAKRLGDEGALVKALGDEGALVKTLNQLNAAKAIVRGQVRQLNGKPVAACKVRALLVSDEGKFALGEDVSDFDGNYTIRYERPAGVESARLAVVALDASGHALCESVMVEDPGPQAHIDVEVAPSTKPAAAHWIEGSICLADGRPAKGLPLRLYRLGFGGKVDPTPLAASTTDDRGGYVFPFDPTQGGASVEIRAVDEEGNEIALSAPLCRAFDGDRTTVNLMAPSTLQPLEPEYERLRHALLPQVYDSMANLAGAREAKDRQDFTVLNRATGWDARLIALAAVAEKLAADPDLKEAGVPPDVLYGMLRVGLPSDKVLLAQVEPAVVSKALKKARDAGVVNLANDAITENENRFASFVTRSYLKRKALGSPSTYGELLNLTLPGQDAQEKFARICLKHGSNTERLWDEVRSAALVDELSETEQLIAKLKLHGKLGLVTVNNAPMIKHLLDRGIQAAADLVTQNLHTAVAWRTEILAAAGIPEERHARLTAADLRTLARFIPAVYKGAKVTDRLDAYAHDMARKMRISYPTEVLTQLIDTDPHFKLISDHEATVKLLKAASAQGFRLGKTPVSGFLRSREGFRADLADDDFQLAVQQLKGLQRIYQITPDNESIAVLNRLNVTSASDVMTCNQNEFEERFSSEYRSLYEKPAPKNTVELIIRKSQQISNISLNVISILTRFGSEPTIYGLSAPDKVREDVREELLKHYPTMESLFGSMDFCECEHCRSVLSPAAYLVDLLQFIDNGESPTPFEELIKRRPDIPYIALTCENTNVTLPYIDLINEILEYYVANEELSKDAANDTGEADTEDLLAEPKFVISKAYDKLRNDIVYPLQLPFDLWLETVRSLCIQLQVPLSRVLEVMAPDEDCFATITAPTNDVNATLCLDDADAPKFKSVQRCTYFRAAKNEPSGEVKKIVDIGPPGSGGTGKSLITLEGVWEVEPQDNDLLVHRPIENRESIFMESLGLSPKEVEIFTDKDLLERWHDLYGFASPEEATENRIDKETGQRVDLNSAKALSRRLGVTYKEITEIIQTGFVNPGLKRLAGIQRIGISLRDIRLYRKECGLYQANPDLLDQDFGALDQTARKALEKLKNRRPDSAVSDWQVVNEVASIEKRVKEYVECFPSPPFDQSPTVLQKILNEIKTLKMDDILVLNDAGTGCDFDQTILQYADGRKAKDIDFLRINLFVRLWRKLGWSIEETDRALITFIPSAAPFKANTLNKQPLRTALIYLAHLKTLDEKLKVGKQSRIKLLTLWSEIPTTGKKSLYEELFLKRDVLEKSPVFDHPLGHYLAESSAKIIDHALALQGALGLAAEEIGLILSDAGKSPNDAPLSLGNVSLLHRYSLLAKALKLSVRELILLRQISGLQPFEPLHPDPLSSIDEDYPFCQTLEFVKVMEEVKDSGFELEDLDYLLRHRFDETGKYRPDRQGTLVYLKSIFDGVSAIRTEYAVPGDADSVTEEELRQKLGLALAPDVVDRLLGMVNGTAEFTSSTLGVKSHGVLPQWCAGAASIERVFYDESNKTQGISCMGVLFDEDKLALQNKFNPQLTSSQRDVLQKLLVRLQETAQASVTQDFTATASNVSPVDALPSDAGDEIVRLDYDPNEKVQKIECKGILSDSKRRELRERMSPKLTPQQMSILDRLLGSIKAQIKADVTETFEVQLDNVTVGGELPPDLLRSQERIADAAYDSSSKMQKQTQKLTVRGVLSDDETADIMARLDGKLATEQRTTLDDLLKGTQKLAREFFDNHLKIQKLRNGVQAGFLEDCDFNELFLSSKTVNERHYRIAKAYLPGLQERLIRQFLIQSLTARTGADPLLVESLLSDERVLVAPQAKGLNSPLIAALAPTVVRGVNATFRVAQDGAGPVLGMVELADADTAGVKDESGKLLIQKGARTGHLDEPEEIEGDTLVPNSARLDAYVQVPATGPYQFYVEIDGQENSTRVQLSFQDLPEPVVSDETTSADTMLELKAGVLHRFSLDLKGFTGDVRMMVQGENLPKGPLAQLVLYPAAAIDAAEQALTLLGKALQLLQGLGLGERETRYILTHKDDFGNLSLSGLPTAKVTDEDANKVAGTGAFGHFRRLAAYARLKRDLAFGTDDLIAIFEANGTKAGKRLDNSVYPLIAKLTRRETATVSATAKTIS